VSDQGLFLVGWFNTEAQSSVRIVCHSGTESFVVSDNWSRHARADVTTYLAGTGIPSGNHAHGFSCYVSLSDSDTPPYLSAQSESGDVRRMRIQVQSKPESALQTVRALATSFSIKHTELRYLLDRQIGPAVGAAWAARSKPQDSMRPGISAPGLQTRQSPLLFRSLAGTTFPNTRWRCLPTIPTSSTRN